MEIKGIYRTEASRYCILIPVYYENEERPSWRKVFSGTHKECENAMINYPDFLHATNEENRQNRQNKIQEYIFLKSTKKFVEAEKIKKQYNL